LYLALPTSSPFPRDAAIATRQLTIPTQSIFPFFLALVLSAEEKKKLGLAGLTHP
jgi:hypothetical protein